ncbi:MarR family winged helix-turn-helix transcriptional regulator [Paralcaligenes sp. KSB-10]|uniref:MarR family winged helix-turn-helix transcriptional regulator n=1 Tax=Paralcaligenes sp. KSB-10 TaxID=2901142 RepID=UPI001E42481B|nr:MarR family winged helix-turn-helix transcriptional regulator [Paralcaligenes sp. KSB-10]UHL65366.1 MarR family winged helix-turn-helix transcriptional regulator [Paralcaligenes sp. KSB-10]
MVEAASRPSPGRSTRAGASPAPVVPEPTIQDMTVFRIYRAWSGANPIFTRLCEGRFNITRREWRILATAAVNGRLGSAALAKAANLDLVRTSRTISTLCNKGWLIRHRNSRDARNIFIDVSEAGHALYRQIMPTIVELNAQVTQDLDADELRVLRKALDKITLRAQRMLEVEIIKERPHRGQPGKRKTG